VPECGRRRVHSRPADQREPPDPHGRQELPAPAPAEDQGLIRGPKPRRRTTSPGVKPLTRTWPSRPGALPLVVRAGPPLARASAARLGTNGGNGGGLQQMQGQTHQPGERRPPPRPPPSPP